MNFVDALRVTGYKLIPVKAIHQGLRQLHNIKRRPRVQNTLSTPN